MRKRFKREPFAENDAGMGTLQSVMILAVSAVVLLGMRMLWDPNYSGSGGLFAAVEKKFDVIFNGGEETDTDQTDSDGVSAGGDGSGGSGSGGSGSGGGGSGGSGSGGNGSGGNGSGGNGSGGNGSGGNGSGDSGSGDSGSGDSGSGDSGSDGNGSDGNGSDGESGDDWNNYSDVVFSAAVETSKLYGKQIIENAKTAALQKVIVNDPLLEAFGMSIKDFDIDDIPARDAAFRGAGIIVDALVGVDGLIEGDAKVRDLADAGDFKGAWNKTWSTPAKYIADTIFASKAVDLVLDRLPGSAQLAIKVGVPEAIEHAATATADALYEPIALSVNERLWELYDKGLVPRPRIPRK